ncbi:DUF6089 family protein [Cesiribacter sp. SM1]|uniref:DUF6089 family protein n=1 Tax=Cesiribacter sp. SM1 TaxID=2861196 RepID=UPI001CD64F75|nr:DUF6089 family protein [Cesiribacter sp. SM1]
MRSYLLPLLLTALPILASAQRYYPTGIQARELIGISVGTTAYYGDIEGAGGFRGANPHLGLSYEYRFMPHWGVRASSSWYKISAADAKSESPVLQARNLSFSSSNLEFSVLAAGYLLPYNSSDYLSSKKFNAYGLLGIGATLFNPKAYYGEEKRALRSIQTEGVRYSRVALVVPFGGGIQYRIASLFDVSLQATYHYTFTDFLDDCSTVYRDPASFSDPVAAALADRRPEVGLEKASAGSVRGNPEVKDSYAMLSLRVQYYLLRYHFRGREIKKLYQ